jgi:hypothetical protein
MGQIARIPLRLVVLKGSKAQRIHLNALNLAALEARKDTVQSKRIIGDRVKVAKMVHNF